MVDFVSNRTGTQVDDVVEAGNNANVTGSDTLLHDGNVGVVIFDQATPAPGSDVINISVGGTSRIDIISAGTVGEYLRFINDNGQIGGITGSGTTITFAVSSDARLKDFKDLPDDTDIDAEFNKLFSCFKVFNWKSDPNGNLVWGFNAHECIDAGLDMGVEGQGSRDLTLGEVYNTIPAVIEPQQIQVLYKTGDKKGEPRLNADSSPMMETVDVVVTPEIEEKVSPAGVDQAKAVPVLLAKIEQQGRYMTALQIGLNDALNRLTAAGI